MAHLLTCEFTKTTVATLSECHITSLRELEVGLTAARSAANFIRRRFRHPVTRTDKGVLDFVTEVGIEAERRIARLLAIHLPEHAVFGEEGGWLQGDASNQFVWLIDPLCGTANFSAGIPFFNVNLLLLEDGHPMIGILAEPMTGDLLWAERGRGAFVITKDGATIPIHSSDDAKIVALDPGFYLKFGEPSKMLRVLHSTIDAKRFLFRVLSSSLALGYTARGSFVACVFEHNETLHVGAGAFICQEAGCVVSDLYGMPWTPESTGLIVAANKEIHRDILGSI